MLSYLNGFRQGLFLAIRPLGYRGGNPEYDQKLMAIVDAIWIGSIPVFLILPVYFYFTRFSAGVWCILHALFYLILLVAVLRYSGNIKCFTHLTAVAIFNSFTFIAALTGGIESPVVVLYTMVIPVVNDFGGPKLAIRWVLIYLLLFLIFAGIDIYLFPFPELLDAERSTYFLFVSMIGIFIFHALYATLWTTGRQQLLNNLAAQQKMLNQQDKMASIGQLTAGIAHEINNPLNFIATNATALQYNLQDLDDLLQQIASLSSATKDSQIRDLQEKANAIDLPTLRSENQHTIRGIQNGTKRISQITQSLRYVSYPDREQKEVVDLHQSLDAALRILHAQYKNRIHIDKDYQAQGTIIAFPGQLNQVFINLLSNAIQAIVGEGHIRITTRSDARNSQVIIQDDGQGMDSTVQRRIFDPFFTTKEVGKGTGLGLSISYQILEAHAATIQVESEPKVGTTFTIEIPNGS